MSDKEQVRTNAREEANLITVSDLSPSVVELLKEFRRTSGARDIPRVIEDITFSVFELLKLVNTSRDPRIYPQDAVRVMDTVKAVLEKFTRFGKPHQLEEAEKGVKTS
ncbi:MAG TPA: hypothetical protein VMT06_02320 [Candidatus Eisenbacteria bacterium]|nr:hypothetical protein [Candidatus Eisenbacteria bacterium]